MKKLRIGMHLSAALIVGTASSAVAQTAEPTYKGDPSVYKVIFEDANFRVIEGIRKKGVHDKVHSHPVPFVVYSVTDCKTKLYAADGKTTELDQQGRYGRCSSGHCLAFRRKHRQRGLQANLLREEIAIPPMLMLFHAAWTIVDIIRSLLSLRGSNCSI